MDVVQAVSGYISKMVTAGDGSSGMPSGKMKILLLDSETVGFICFGLRLEGVRLIVIPGVNHVKCNYSVRASQS